MSPAPERSRARNQESRTPASRVPARSRAHHRGSCARHIDKVPRSGESIADDAPTSPRPSPNLFISLMRWALVPLAWFTRVHARRDRAVRAFGPRGRRRDVAAPACSPSPPLGAERAGERWGCLLPRVASRDPGTDTGCRASHHGPGSCPASEVRLHVVGPARGLSDRPLPHAAMPGLVPGIPRARPAGRWANTWMAGTSPAMTCRGRRASHHGTD